MHKNLKTLSLSYTRKKFARVGFDADLWKKYYKTHQQDYKRIKLKALYAYWQGESFAQIAKKLCKNPQTIRNYVNTYLEGGFCLLCQSIQRNHCGQLSSDQEQAFKKVILTSSPDDHDLAGNIWTGALMCQYLSKTYQVNYSWGIYDLLKRLNLSYQRAHSDYTNASLEQQQAFIKDFKQTLLSADEQTAVLAFDEFSVSEHPSNYYGWAEKNTRPKVKTDEKKTKN